MKKLAWITAIVSLVIGILSWLIGSGPVKLVMLLIIAACTLTTILVIKNLNKTGGKKESNVPTYIAYAGFLLCIISVFIEQMSSSIR
jgi:hypothetical protein